MIDVQKLREAAEAIHDGAPVKDVLTPDEINEIILVVARLYHVDPAQQKGPSEEGQGG